MVKMIISLTTTENQKNSTYNNMTSINLEQSESLLRQYYSNNETIYIKKIDVIQEKMKISKIVYDVYSKLHGTNLIKLNLSIYEQSQISLTIPIKLNESIDILNTSSQYYKDICYLSTSESETDMIINDRKKEFVENNRTVCQEYCNFSDYNYDEQKAICSCLIKEYPFSYAEMKIDISKLYENFDDINNKYGISNLGLTSCNVLSSTENIESNTGFYLLLFILVAFVI